MTDRLLPFIEWIEPLLRRPFPPQFGPGTVGHEVLAELSHRWGEDTAEVLVSLSDRYGQQALDVVGEFLEYHIRRDWPEIGAREAHEGTEVADLERLLWNPPAELGFQFTRGGDDSDRQFFVTRCPIYEAAAATDTREWMSVLACATDGPTAESFSPHIEFRRTKTLMSGCDCCDHRYLRI